MCYHLSISMLNHVCHMSYDRQTDNTYHEEPCGSQEPRQTQQKSNLQRLQTMWLQPPSFSIVARHFGHSWYKCTQQVWCTRRFTHHEVWAVNGHPTTDNSSKLSLQCKTKQKITKKTATVICRPNMKSPRASVNHC